MKNKDIIHTRYLLFIFFICAILAISGFSEEKMIQSVWTSSPVTVDGSFADWIDVSFSSETNLGIDYAFKNDEGNFYALLVFKNPKSLSSIGATGITLWLNPEGKEEKKQGVLFIQKQISAMELITLLEKKSGPLSEEKKVKIRSRSSYLINDAEVVGSEKNPALQHSETEMVKPASFQFMKIQDSYVFEFFVSLVQLREDFPQLAAEPGKNITAGFEWGGMTTDMKKEMMRRSAEFGKAATSGEEFSGDREGMAGESSLPIGTFSGPKKHEMWVNVQLASEQK